MSDVADSKDELPLLVVVGPTASGKTSLATELALRHAGEIITADSVQVYRHFDIGSGKPTAAERAAVAHHLLDIADPRESFDAARFVEAASIRIREIRARGRLPIVCGGTFLWVRALIYGLAKAPPASAEIRARHQQIAAESGRAVLHAELTAVDPTSAARLSPNDLMRVSRALEVHELTGIPLSRWHADHGFRNALYRARLLGVRRSREELDARIVARVEAMWAAGWLAEVERLVELGFRDTRPMGAVGYRQVLAALSNPAVDPSTLLPAIVRATRIFARRQRTWLREEAVEYLDPEGREFSLEQRAPSFTP